jgi:hypothetical protein
LPWPDSLFMGMTGMAGLNIFMLMWKAKAGGYEKE